MRSAWKRAKTVAVCTVAIALAAAPERGPGESALASPPAPLFAPFQHAPLDGELILTGSFGEYRPGRFHAGLDLSTGEETGKPVYAPLDGSIARVRASGVGYGRSIYLQTADGRMIVLGHLDAFDEPLASYVSAAQDSSGQYEQDLWPEGARFRVHAGQRLGWSGRSGGVGQPHLHLEVRRGDMAINPLIAGASVEDTTAPVITGITVEPRTPECSVNGRAAPVRLALGAAPETVRVQGVARLEVEARDPGLRRADMQPYEIEMSWEGGRVACRFDSLSWATDMPEGDLVYDVGRLSPARKHAVLLWANGQSRPRAIVGNGENVAGEHHVMGYEIGNIGGAGSMVSKLVTVRARDLAGHVAERSFTVELSPAAIPAFHSPSYLLGAPFGPGPIAGSAPGFGWGSAPEVSYGPGTGLDSLRSAPIPGQAPAGDLIPVGRSVHLFPDWLPLRDRFYLRASVPVARPDRQLGLYTRRDGGWDLMDASPDTTTRSWLDRITGADSNRVSWLKRPEEEWTRPSWIARPSHLGQFAFFEDRAAPRITLLKPPHSRGSATPYSRWALEARLEEAGSGVAARASALVVDGRRRPTEWDPVERKLRWKPRTPPAAGTHRYVVIAADKAGNQRRVSGTFVIN